MRFYLRIGAICAALFTSSLALEITSPSSGSAIDPTKPLTISWSISYTDPSVIDLKISSGSNHVTLATGAVTYAGSYTVPAGTLQGLGSGYAIVAVGNANTLAQVTGLSLGGSGSGEGSSSSGGNGQTSTVAQVTMTSTQTVIPTPAAATGSGGSDASSGSVPTTSVDSAGVTTMSGTRSLASTTHTGSSFVTSKTSKASSGSSTATATAGTTNTASGQRRLGGELVLGAAGVLAGIVALLA